jgi:hypothetical protein
MWVYIYRERYIYASRTLYIYRRGEKRDIRDRSRRCQDIYIYIERGIEIERERTCDRDI